MDNILVIYSSKYGFTEKYAVWIAGELKADICKLSKFNQNSINNYDVIIVGSGLYAGNIKGANIIVNNYDKIKNKRIVLFTCGLADYSKTENINNISERLKEVIPQDIMENIKVFNVRGGINYKCLSLKHKIMMGLMKKMLMKKGLDKLDEEGKEFMETYGKTIDFTDKNSINEIINYCKSFPIPQPATSA